MKRITLCLAIAAVIFLSPVIKPVELNADQHEEVPLGVQAAINLLLLGRERVDPELVARLRANVLVPPPLERADVPDMQHIVDEYLNGAAGKQWAIVLGKAFFWDQGAGSDGIACASCHFQAGADPRSKNQISPGLLNRTPGVDPEQFDLGGPNFQLSTGSFPTSRNIDDGISSQGVFLADFSATDPDGGNDICTPRGGGLVFNDPVFHVNGTAVRRVEPRNTPTVINAVFNHRNFWDGRANNHFNGVDPFGRRSNEMNPVDPVTFAGTGIWIRTQETPEDPFTLTKVQVLIHNSSLASQAVGPPLSDIEMSCAGRTFPDVGRKMLRRDRVLRDQQVHPEDSVLGPHVHSTGRGLQQNYTQLIRAAFQEKYWGGGVVPDGSGYTQMEANFSLFWGLALQFYQATLISNQTPFDAFARGDDLALTNRQLQGLEAFIGPGLCIFCHGNDPEVDEATGEIIVPGGGEFTSANVEITTLEPTERMVMIGNMPAVYDNGFYNIGVSLADADPGVGGTVGEIELDFGAPDPQEPVTPIPICYSRQAAEGPLVDEEAGADAAADDNDPDTAPAGPIQTGERVACDGAFKVPTVRNVALTAPYFHNGSHGTLKQVMDSYRVNMTNRFADENIDNLAPLIPLMVLTEEEDDLIIEFLRALTDRRVALEQAPFDHPELRVPNGHPGDHLSVVDSNDDGRADDNFIVIPAVGAKGRMLPPAPFLNIVQ